MWVKSIASKNWLKQQKLRARHPCVPVCARHANSIHRSQLNWYSIVFQFKECPSLTTCASIRTIWRKRTNFYLIIRILFTKRKSKKQDTGDARMRQKRVSAYSDGICVGFVFTLPWMWVARCVQNITFGSKHWPLNYLFILFMYVWMIVFRYQMTLSLVRCYCRCLMLIRWRWLLMNLLLLTSCIRWRLLRTIIRLIFRMKDDRPTIQSYLFGIDHIPQQIQRIFAASVTRSPS